MCYTPLTISRTEDNDMDYYDDLHWRLYGVELDPDDKYDIEGRPVPPKSVRSSRFTYSRDQDGAGILEIDGQQVQAIDELRWLGRGGAFRSFTKAWMSAQLE